MTIIITEIVLKRLKRLDANKAAGPDSIAYNPDYYFLKEAADQIAQPEAVMFRMSLTSKVLPSDKKQANIKPKFKKGRRNQACNHCTISLTSVVCNFLESIINDALVSHLKRNRSLSKSQHGFYTGHSTNTNLIESYDFVNRLFDDDLWVDSILLDQDFDKVQHQHQFLLLKKGEYRVHEDIGQILIKPLIKYSINFFS